MAKPNLTAERLRELLHYDPETGIFKRRVDSRRRKNTLVPTGGKKVSGHISIYIIGGEFFAHRLAWLYTFGKWPIEFIDHINGIKSDNRIVNLREANASINNQNRRAKNPQTGALLGVHKKVNTCVLSRPYTAKIAVTGKTLHLGYFKTEIEAHEAYLDAKRKMHPGCTI